MVINSDGLFRCMSKGKALALLLIASAATVAGAAEAAKNFFESTRVHEITLHFTAKEWEGIEPKRTEMARPPFGAGGVMNLAPEGEGAPSRNGVSAMMGLEFQWVHGDFEINGERITNVAIRYKGNGTYVFAQNSEKRPFKVDFNKYIKGQKLAGRISQLNLANNVADPSNLRDALSNEVFREGGVPAPGTAYARVRLNVPGEHENRLLGVYTLIQDVDDNFTEEHFQTRKGLLLKPSTPKPFEYLGEDWKTYEKRYDPKNNVSKEEEKRVIAFARLVTEAAYEEFNKQLADYVELDNFARFMALNVYLSNLDGILAVGQNYYVFLDPRTKKFSFIPWDSDHSWGEFPLIGTQEERDALSIKKPYVGENRFLERMFAHPEVRRLYLGYLKDFRTRIFEPRKIEQRINELARILRPLIKEESTERLENFDKALAAKAASSEDSGAPGPGGFRFQMPVASIKHFVSERHKSVGEQLAGKSEGRVIERRMGPPGGGGFGPAMILAPRFMESDKDKDGLLSDEEFAAAGKDWFARITADNAPPLNEEGLRKGLNALFPVPAFPGPGGPRGGSSPGAPPSGGGFNRPGGPPRGGFGPPPGFGPGNFLAGGFMSAMDAGKDGSIDETEFQQAFERWFAAWDADKDQNLSDKELRDGINKDLSPFGGSGPGPRNAPGNFPATKPASTQ